MLRAAALISVLLLPHTAAAQSPSYSSNAQIGIVMPITLSAGVLRTHRARAIDPAAATWSAGFRANAYPAMKLGTRWYFYSALQFNSEPYLFYNSYYPEYGLKARVLQAFLGYRWAGESTAVSLKAGHLSTAFGAFPLQYDEAANPLIDEPLAYSSPLRIRPDALPCGVRDLPNLRPYTEYVGVRFYCGGPQSLHRGMLPLTLYGLPGVELGVSFANLDARLQLTNSSPANPQGLLSDSQHPQWTGGAGLTLWQGFRLGFSASRGTFLESSVNEFMRDGATVDDFPATAVGADVQLARGRWSAKAEWLRFSFSYPRLFAPLTLHAAYGELKMILTPRIYAAFRSSWQVHNRLIDRNGQSQLPYQPNAQAFELTLGFRPNRWQLLKMGYERHITESKPGHRDDVLGIRLVTSLDALSLPLK